MKNESKIFKSKNYQIKIKSKSTNHSISMFTKRDYIRISNKYYQSINQELKQIIKLEEKKENLKNILSSLNKRQPKKILYENRLLNEKNFEILALKENCNTLKEKKNFLNKKLIDLKNFFFFINAKMNFLKKKRKFMNYKKFQKKKFIKQRKNTFSHKIIFPNTGKNLKNNKFSFRELGNNNKEKFSLFAKRKRNNLKKKYRKAFLKNDDNHEFNEKINYLLDNKKKLSFFKKVEINEKIKQEKILKNKFEKGLIKLANQKIKKNFLKNNQKNFVDTMKEKKNTKKFENKVEKILKKNDFKNKKINKRGSAKKKKVNSVKKNYLQKNFLINKKNNLSLREKNKEIFKNEISLKNINKKKLKLKIKIDKNFINKFLKNDDKNSINKLDKIVIKKNSLDEFQDKKNSDNFENTNSIKKNDIIFEKNNKKENSSIKKKKHRKNIERIIFIKKEQSKKNANLKQNSSKTKINLKNNTKIVKNLFNILPEKKEIFKQNSKNEKELDEKKIKKLNNDKNFLKKIEKENFNILEEKREFSINKNNLQNSKKDIDLLKNNKKIILPSKNEKKFLKNKEMILENSKKKTNLNIINEEELISKNSKKEKLIKKNSKNQKGLLQNIKKNEIKVDLTKKIENKILMNFLKADYLIKRSQSSEDINLKKNNEEKILRPKKNQSLLDKSIFDRLENSIITKLEKKIKIKNLKNQKSKINPKKKIKSKKSKINKKSIFSQKFKNNETSISEKNLKSLIKENSIILKINSLCILKNKKNVKNEISFKKNKIIKTEISYKNVKYVKSENPLKNQTSFEKNNFNFNNPKSFQGENTNIKSFSSNFESSNDENPLVNDSFCVIENYQLLEDDIFGNEKKFNKQLSSLSINYFRKKSLKIFDFFFGKKNLPENLKFESKRELIPKNHKISKIKFFFFEQNLTGFKLNFFSLKDKNKIKGHLHGEKNSGKQKKKILTYFEKLNGMICVSNLKGIKFLKFISNYGNVFKFGNEEITYSDDNFDISYDIPNMAEIRVIDSVFYRGKIVNFSFKYYLEEDF